MRMGRLATGLGNVDRCMTSALLSLSSVEPSVARLPHRLPPLATARSTQLEACLSLVARLRFGTLPGLSGAFRAERLAVAHAAMQSKHDQSAIRCSKRQLPRAMCLARPAVAHSRARRRPVHLDIEHQGVAPWLGAWAAKTYRRQRGCRLAVKTQVDQSLDRFFQLRHPLATDQLARAHRRGPADERGGEPRFVRVDVNRRHLAARHRDRVVSSSDLQVHRPLPAFVGWRVRRQGRRGRRDESHRRGTRGHHHGGRGQSHHHIKSTGAIQITAPR
jgi:hypothetical protein